MTRAKICGLTRLEDAETAVAHGAWALGFILWPGSARAVAPEDAVPIAAAMRRSAALVGVFVDQPLEEVVAVAEALRLSHLQLHGSEGTAYCAEAARRTGARVIKAVTISSGADLQAVEAYRNVDLHLLDSRPPGRRDAAGATWEWALASRRRSAVPKVLSGGLDADNVAAGIAAVSPYAVDVASGVEVPGEPGIKDPERIAAFLAAVRAASPPPVAPAPAPSVASAS